jgi:exodeoxyribonuclease VII small subunit
MMEHAKELDFEQALSQLEGLVSELESGDLSLEDSLRAFEQGVHLVRQCSERLQAAELRVRQLEDGNERPLEVREGE